ncbi:hypothetical protein [Thiorhodovibrio litoralis]|uniref:hypothetical protein n=1 Tax=Thiorhodovibrio litoralis TaxID=2952932 RepID=UPI002B261AB7|nr:hypothetical protein [Thiorhodovibrio litoralis]WPL12189.1 hypothetical protein Thiosp_01949 [Thiorhodovibrio litoralis]
MGATPEAWRDPAPDLIRPLIKTAIVELAVTGFIPAAFATWLIQRGGLLHA